MKKTHKRIPGGDRYIFDLALRPEDGWAQWDTKDDAWYHGIWVHAKNLLIVIFAEGDHYEIECETSEEFENELRRMAEVYGDPPPAVTTYDPETGQVTEIYQMRVMAADSPADES